MTPLRFKVYIRFKWDSERPDEIVSVITDGIFNDSDLLDFFYTKSEHKCSCNLTEAQPDCEGDCDRFSEFSEMDIVAIVQSTGLTDKNGKEIFEGDIMRAYSKEKNDGGVAKVIFQIGCFGLLGLSAGYFHNFDTITESYGDEMEYEIIGNIYENPELLSQPTT